MLLYTVQVAHISRKRKIGMFKCGWMSTREVSKSLASRSPMSSWATVQLSWAAPQSGRERFEAL